MDKSQEIFEKSLPVDAGRCGAVRSGFPGSGHDAEIY